LRTFVAVSAERVKPEIGSGRRCLEREQSTFAQQILPPIFQHWNTALHNLLSLAAVLRISCPRQKTGSAANRARRKKGRALMPAKDEPVVIKKYANRRLYNTGTSTYVTLEDLADMVKRGEDFTVQDAKTGEDITHPVLTQIIFELENKEGQNMLPTSFLRQLISFYGDQMQMILPSFLEQSMIAFAKEQERFREQLKSAFGKSPMDMMKFTPMKAIEEQTRRNIEVFQDAMRMFMAFPQSGNSGNAQSAEAPKKEAREKPDELQELKDQLAAMQRKLDSLAK